MGQVHTRLMAAFAKKMSAPRIMVDANITVIILTARITAPAPTGSFLPLMAEIVLKTTVEIITAAISAKTM